MSENIDYGTTDEAEFVSIGWKPYCLKIVFALSVNKKSRNVFPQAG